MKERKSIGWIKNPKKAAYNKVYKKTSFDIMDIFKQLAVGLHHGTSSKVFKRSREVLFSNS